MQNIKSTLDACVRDRTQVSIERDDIDDQPIVALVLAVNNRLVLLQYLYDFYIDGCKVLCLEDITGIRKGKTEAFHDEILRGEGMLELPREAEVPVDSWMSFFGRMFEEDRMIDISLERTGDDEMFFVGKVAVVEKDSLELREIDALGNYDDEWRKIYYRDITMVSFGNRYGEFLDKYSRKIKK